MRSYLSFSFCLFPLFEDSKTTQAAGHTGLKHPGRFRPEHADNGSKIFLQWTYHNDKSTAFIINAKVNHANVTIKVPNRTKRFTHITQPKTDRKNLGKSIGLLHFFNVKSFLYANFELNTHRY